MGEKENSSETLVRIDGNEGRDGAEFSKDSIDKMVEEAGKEPEKKEEEKVEEEKVEEKQKPKEEEELSDEDIEKEVEEEDKKDNEKITALETKIADLEKRLGEKPKVEPEKPKELTEEEWIKREEELGIPRSAIQHYDERINSERENFKTGLMTIGNMLVDFVNSRMGNPEVDGIIGKLSKEQGFEDIGNYSKEIKESLKKYDAKHHTDPDLIKAGYYEALGKSAKKIVKDIKDKNEKNVKIIKKSQTTTQKIKEKDGEESELTDSDRQAMRMTGLSEEDYRKTLGSGDRVTIR